MQELKQETVVSIVSQGKEWNASELGCLLLFLPCLRESQEGLLHIPSTALQFPLHFNNMNSIKEFGFPQTEEQTETQATIHMSLLTFIVTGLPYVCDRMDSKHVQYGNERM